MTITTVATMAARYEVARHEYESNQIGPRTDRAYAKMERIVEQAERAGVLDELIAAVTK